MLRTGSERSGVCTVGAATGPRAGRAGRDLQAEQEEDGALPLTGL